MCIHLKTHELCMSVFRAFLLKEDTFVSVNEDMAGRKALVAMVILELLTGF